MEYWSKNHLFDETDDRFDLLTDFIKVDLTLPDLKLDIANLWSYWLLGGYNEFSMDHVSNLSKYLDVPFSVRRRKIQTLSLALNSPLIAFQPVSIFDSYGTSSSTTDTQDSLGNLVKKYELYFGKDITKRQFLSFIVT